MATAKAPRKSDKAPEDAPIPFERAMSRLTAIVTELEEGQLSLEDSLARFEEGVALAKVSQLQLDEAEAKVEELLGVDAKGPQTKEIDE